MHNYEELLLQLIKQTTRIADALDCMDKEGIVVFGGQTYEEN